MYFKKILDVIRNVYSSLNSEFSTLKFRFSKVYSNLSSVFWTLNWILISIFLDSKFCIQFSELKSKNPHKRAKNFSIVV